MPKIFPIYLFTGDDGHLKKEAVQKLKRALLGNDESEAFNFDAYDTASCDIREAISTLKSVPFIANKRLVLFRKIDAANRQAQQAIVKYAKNPSKNSCLVLESSKREFSGAFHKELAGLARAISFTLPMGGRITGWIQKEVKAKGKSMHYDAATLLKELKQDDVNSLRCEIEKLVTYVGRRPIISREDVRNLVGSSASRTVFQFVDALSKKDAKEALSIAKELFRTKKTVPEILGMIGWQFRRIKKAREDVKRDTSGIDANIADLLKADYSIKRGHIKPREALEALIIKICAGKSSDRHHFSDT